MPRHIVTGIMDAILLMAVVSSQSQMPHADTASFDGQVVEQGSNAPVSGARVILAASPPLRMSPAPQAVSDVTGHFAFGELPGGQYSVVVLKAGFIQGGPSSTFELAPGQQLQGIVVSIERGGVITGRVVDPLGNPVADAKVIILQRTNREAQSRLPIYWPLPRFEPAGGFSQTNDIGEFRIIGLRSGAYFVGATPPPFEAYKNGAAPSETRLVETLYPGTVDDSEAKPIIVVAGRTISDVTIRLVALSTFHVSGIVVDAQGTAVSGATVTIEAGSRTKAGAEGTTRTDDNGEFRINLANGSYTLIASAPLQRGARPVDPTRIPITIVNASVDNLRVVVRTNR